MCKKKAIATTLQEAIDYYYKVEVIYMLSGVGALRAPDFDGPDAGLGCDGAVNNKDSPSLFSLSPLLLPLSPFPRVYKSTRGPTVEA